MREKTSPPHPTLRSRLEGRGLRWPLASSPKEAVGWGRERETAEEEEGRKDAEAELGA